MEFPKIETQPVAAATAIIQGITYRISVLTERLLRLEYNETGHFEDRASQVVWNRAFPKVEFEVNETEEELELETSFLHMVDPGKKLLHPVLDLCSLIFLRCAQKAQRINMIKNCLVIPMSHCVSYLQIVFY